MQPTASDQAYGGHASDQRTGYTGAAADLDESQPNPVARLGILREINAGRLQPNPESRLGAYAATVGYPSGTVGFAVHNAIGSIYLAMGTLGEERIGVVFNSPQARALYHLPVNSPASRQMAEFEHAYWDQVRQEDSWSVGGQLGSAFSPDVRDQIQQAMGGSSGESEG